MEQARNHPMDVNDENFYKVALNELSNIQAYLEPQFHQVLQRRSKINMLRASLAASVVPMMIEFKEAVEKQNLTELFAELNELQDVNKSLEHIYDSTMKTPSPQNP